MGILMTSDASAAAATTGGMTMFTVMYIVLIVGVLYFFMIRPQKKEQKRVGAMLASMEIGDSVLTTSGFYGVVIDNVDENVVIVEFGNNKNCRIPMKKTAVVEVEKANKE